jgi:hypothetical protein
MRSGVDPGKAGSPWGRLRFRNGILEALVLLALLFPVFLAAGYHGAFGQIDAAGRPVGFNDPILFTHGPLFVQALTAESIWKAAMPWTLAAVGAQVVLTRLPFLPRRVGIFHASSFLLMAAGGLLLLLDHRPTGECIVEGELSTAMPLLLWAVAWVPAGLAALPWKRIWKGILPS